LAVNTTALQSLPPLRCGGCLVSRAAVGPSEGELITGLAVEQYANVFDSGLSMCGPVGDFRRQVNYWGDVRVLFDYFFPDVVPGSPVQVPQEVIDNWETVYEELVEDEMRADSYATDQLLNVARVPVDPKDPDSGIDALVLLVLRVRGSELPDAQARAEYWNLARTYGLLR
jgi:hypothetical protein